MSAKGPQHTGLILSLRVLSGIAQLEVRWLRRDRKAACSSLKPGAYYNIVGCISMRPYKQPSIAAENSTGDSTGVNT